MEALRADIARQVSKRQHCNSDPESSTEELVRPAKYARHEGKRRSAPATQSRKAEDSSETSAQSPSSASSATLTGDQERRVKLCTTSESNLDDSSSGSESNTSSDDESSSKDSRDAPPTPTPNIADETGSSSSDDWTSSNSNVLPHSLLPDSMSESDSSISDGEATHSIPQSLNPSNQYLQDSDSPSSDLSKESSEVSGSTSAEDSSSDDSNSSSSNSQLNLPLEANHLPPDSPSTSTSTSSSSALPPTRPTVHVAPPPHPFKTPLTAQNLSALQSRLQSFLPQLRTANEELERQRENGTLGERNIENLDKEEDDDDEEDNDDDENPNNSSRPYLQVGAGHGEAKRRARKQNHKPYIEMELGLGVLEEQRSADAEVKKENGEEPEEGGSDVDFTIPQLPKLMPEVLPRKGKVGIQVVDEEV